MMNLYDIREGKGFEFKGEQYILVRKKTTNAIIENRQGKKFNLNMQVEVEPIDVDFEVTIEKKKEFVNNFEKFAIGEHIKFKGMEFAILKKKKVKALCVKVNTNDYYDIRMSAFATSLNKVSKVYTCGYCGNLHIDVCPLCVGE